MIDEDEPVGALMRRRPQTIRVFLDYRFECVGCPIAFMHSVADAIREHNADRVAFLSALDAAMGESESEWKRDPAEAIGLSQRRRP